MTKGARVFGLVTAGASLLADVISLAKKAKHLLRGKGTVG